jgi:preprotein translocase subunit SecG
MMILFWLLLVVFVIVCVLLCFLVLIQSDKGGGISGAIGGGLGGANSLLGTQDTANILTRGSVIFGVAFLLLCLGMAKIMTGQTIVVQKGVMEARAEKMASTSPAWALQHNNGMQLKSGAQQKAGVPVKSAPGSAPAKGSSSTPEPTAIPKGLPIKGPAGSGTATPK